LNKDGLSSLCIIVKRSKHLRNISWENLIAKVIGFVECGPCTTVPQASKSGGQRS
jgi:hypothetical protein